MVCIGQTGGGLVHGWGKKRWDNATTHAHAHTETFPRSLGPQTIMRANHYQYESVRTDHYRVSGLAEINFVWSFVCLFTARGDTQSKTVRFPHPFKFSLKAGVSLTCSHGH